MKILGTLIVLCLLGIGFNVMFAFNSMASESEIYIYADRIAKLGVTLIPLVLIFIVVWAGKKLTKL